MPNIKSVEYLIVVTFGEGCCSSSSRRCDRGKTKSTPCLFDLDWNGLGLEFDNDSHNDPSLFHFTTFFLFFF